jgi:hypothetical protein
MYGSRAERFLTLRRDSPLAKILFFCPKKTLIGLPLEIRT